MGTETVSKAVMDNGYEDSDDDKPVVFKRKSSVASNSNQSKFNPQRSKAVPSSKVLPMRSPVTSTNGTTSSNRSSTVKSSLPSCSSKASPAKSPLRNDTSSTVKDRSQSHKDQSECKSEHEDSEDNRPLSSILSGNSSRPNKGPTSSRQVSSPQPQKKNSGDRPCDRANRIIKDESDDETPISNMFRKKIDSGMSGGKQVSNDEKKPLAKKLHQNGSTLKNEMPNSKVLGKRPLEKYSSADQSSLKKVKVSASPTSVKMKQDSVKNESDDKGRVLVSPKPMKAKQLSTREDGTDDDDDDVPISKRFKSDSSNSKPSSAKPKAVKLNSTSSAAKPKVTRVVSPRSRTMTKNSKKVTKDSNYSTSSTSLPSSGDGQKKWTTLVHNGVIFPPPYKPHSIKILYKGKPVDLTTEQEEVVLSIHVVYLIDKCYTRLLMIFRPSQYLE